MFLSAKKVTMFKNICYIVSIITFSHASNAHNIRSFRYERLVSDLSAHVNAKCVFFVNAGFFDVESDLVERIKTLSKNGTAVGSLKAQDIMKTSQKYRCKINRPIYALFADQQTKQFLQIMYKVGITIIHAKISI